MKNDESKKLAAGLMSQVEYAKHRGVNPSYITRLKVKGILVMRGKLVDVAASDAILDDRPDVEQPATAAPPAESAPSFASARTADMVCRARLRKLELDRAEGRALDAEAAQKSAASDYRTVRDALLGLPDRLAATLAAETDQQKVHTLMRVEIARSLEAAANAIHSA